MTKETGTQSVLQESSAGCTVTVALPDPVPAPQASVTEATV